MTWLLDTNAVIHAIRNRPVTVRQRLDRASPDDVFVSSVTIAELWYGIARSDEPERREAVFRAFLEPFTVVAFDRAAAEQHGRLRHQLRHKPIGERDLLIAATALAGNHVVITHNLGEFSRVSGLAVEDWTRA